MLGKRFRLGLSGEEGSGEITIATVGKQSHNGLSLKFRPLSQFYRRLQGSTGRNADQNALGGVR